eukprot:scaffold8224_cov118-Isochrysis_galbana.AAC.4
MGSGSDYNGDLVPVQRAGARERARARHIDSTKRAQNQDTMIPIPCTALAISNILQAIRGGPADLNGQRLTRRSFSPGCSVGNRFIGSAEPT